MITRANIRRQLRASGGITNAISRKDYSMGGSIGGGIIQGNPMGTRTGYFNPFKIVKKGLKKVANVAKQVVKSPLGKAALLGLGASFLGPSIGGSGIGGLFKGGFKNMLGSFASQLGPQATSGSGLLGLLGKGKNILGNLSGASKLAGGAGLLSYFMSKGATEEEAKSLEADVNRGSGMGFDQIQRDIAAYRGGGQDESQMAAKGYRFLTPRNFVGAEGGRVGLRQGSPEEGIKSLEAGALPIKVEGDVRPKEMKMAAYEPGKATTGDLYDLNNPDYQGINKKIVIEFIQEGIPLGYRSPEEYYEDFYGGYKKGGRVGLKSGGDPLPEDPTKPINPFGPKPTGPVLPNKMAEIPKGLSMQDAVKTFTLSNGRKPKSVQELIKFFKNRKLSAMGGIMDMPTGNMRRNKAGIKEIDYRATGGFVPVGIKEKADDVPAMLSKNEFVMTADAVRGAGDGSIKKGAQRMYDLMKQNESKVV